MMKCTSNGRLAAIFFTAIGVNASAQTLLYQHDTLFSSGGLSADYWAQQNLTERPSRVVMLDDARLRASLDLAGQAFWIEHRLLGEYRGNSNVLALAAQPNTAVKPTQTSNFPLFGTVRTFDFDTLGTSLEHQFAPSWTVSVSPQLVFLKNYSETNGRGDLITTATSANAVGQINRYGMRTYGFTVQEQSIRFDPGWSVDLNTQYRGEYVKFDLSVKNFASEISGQGLHYSFRDYNVHTDNGALNLSAIPSVSGRYGQQNTKLSLPKITEVNVTPIAWHGASLGAFGVENDFVPMLSYRADLLLPGVMVQMMGQENWRLSYSFEWLKTKGSASVTWGAGLAPIWQLDALSLAF
ncbi:MAG: hypothetical protein QE283_14395 [Rhodoferax sp.]|nr:hypothetical protein [Rhodoferax sp.]